MLLYVTYDVMLLYVTYDVMLKYYFDGSLRSSIAVITRFQFCVSHVDSLLVISNNTPLSHCYNISTICLCVRKAIPTVNCLHQNIAFRQNHQPDASI